jgi:type I restriction enzyme R subunit
MTIPTISQKLSTGVDARNIRSIVLMRPIGSMIEFKQIIGRATRLYDGKDNFTIYEFVEAHPHFSDPEWDGEPLEPELCTDCGKYPCECIKDVCPECGRLPCACPFPDCGEPPCVCPCPKCGAYPCECPSPRCSEWPCACERKGKARRKLADGKERTIQHMMCTTFWHPDGTPMSAQQFMELLFGKLSEFFKD